MLDKKVNSIHIITSSFFIHANFITKFLYYRNCCKKTFVSNIMTGTHYDIQSRLLNKFFKNSVGISSLEESENLDTPQIGHFATIILYF